MKMVVYDEKYTVRNYFKDDTLEDVINKINADSGVTVFFDEKISKIFNYS